MSEMCYDCLGEIDACAVKGKCMVEAKADGVTERVSYSLNKLKYC